MTNPTITYNHGVLYDFDSVSAFFETEDGSTGTFTTDGDVVDLSATLVGGNEDYHITNTANLGLSPTTYTTIIVRYMTSSTSIKAKVVLEDSNGDTQTVLADTSSTSWATVSATIDFGDAHNLDHIRLHADHATGHVYYDFALVCMGVFTFPFVHPDGIKISFPNRYADLQIPGRVGSITQYLGMDSPTITLGGNMDTSTNWELTNVDLGVLYNIMYYAYLDPWQWFTSGLYPGCKVTPRNFTVSEDCDPTAVKKWSLEFKKYTLIQPTTDFSPMTW